jgi:hypothetical protein
MKISEILDRAAFFLADSEHARWSRSFLLELTNDALRQVVLVRPDAAARIEALKLAPGSMQRLPSGSGLLLDVIRNMGSDGTSPGAPIRKCMSDDLDIAAPERHVQAGTGTIDEYMYDLRTPTSFQVHPAVPESPAVYVEIAHVAAPAPLAEDENLPLSEIYAGPILDWILHRAYLADSDSPNGRSRAEAHYEAFFRVLGEKSQSDIALAGNNGALK